MSELEQLKRRIEHSEQWYAVRFKRLADLGKQHGIWPEMAAIMANGTSTGIRDETGEFHYDPPTYDQQMNMLRHRLQKAEAELQAYKAKEQS